MSLLYFICTGNSARSQMAEGFARALAGPEVDVVSGGVEPSSLHPLAVTVMAEVGIDISRHFSKSVDISLLNQASVVVTLCGDANERCPVISGPATKQHWDLPDPTRARGTSDERLSAFRAVRDEIRAHVAELLAQNGWAS